MVWHKTVFLPPGRRLRDVEGVVRVLTDAGLSSCVWGTDLLYFYGLPDSPIELNLLVHEPRKAVDALVVTGYTERASEWAYDDGFFSRSPVVKRDGGRSIRLHHASHFYAAHLLPDIPPTSPLYPPQADMAPALMRCWFYQDQQTLTALTIFNWVAEIFEHFPTMLSADPEWPPSVQQLFRDLLDGIAGAGEKARAYYRGLDDTSLDPSAGVDKLDAPA